MTLITSEKTLVGTLSRFPYLFLSLLPSHSLTLYYKRKNVSVQKIGVEASKIGGQKAKKKKDVENERNRT